MRFTSRSIVVAVALLGALYGACRSNLSPGWRVEDTRVLGAHVTVNGDASVAQPKPGDRVRVEFFVASPPGTSPALSWAGFACVPLPVRSGAPQCAGGALGAPSIGTGTPVFEFQVPPSEQLGGAQSILFFGVVCTGGQPSLEGSDASSVPGCDAASTDQTVLSFSLGLAQSAATPNRNPSLADSVFTYAGSPWPAETDLMRPARGCESTPAADLPRVMARVGAEDSEKQDITYTVAASNLETYTTLVPSDGGAPTPTSARESLQLGQFGSGGRVSRQFTLIRDEAGAALTTFQWEAPPVAEAARGGQLVRFWFTVRDGRGGFATTSRALCVTGGTKDD